MYLQQVVSSFSRAAMQYDSHAEVQLLSAQKLHEYLQATAENLPAGDVLELGCGTGLFSKYLVETFADRRVELTDASEDMVQRCKARLTVLQTQHDNLHFTTASVETLAADKKYAVIAAAFTLQWMNDLQGTLEKLTSALVPGGKLFFSMPTAGSFPEWKNVSRIAGVTFTANELPEQKTIRAFAAARGGGVSPPLRVGLYEETIRVNYKTMHEFLRSLKNIGAQTQSAGKRLTVSEMRKLFATAKQQYPGGFPATYKVLFGHFSAPIQ